MTGSETIRSLGFDFGTRQIGVASGQSITGTAAPLTILSARDGIPDWQQITHLIKEWQPDVLVVGLPLNMDDTEGEIAILARKFARRLQGRFNLKTVMVDERLTTYVIKKQLAEEGNPSSSKRRVDADAAALLLESWFSAPERAQEP